VRDDITEIQKDPGRLARAFDVPQPLAGELHLRNDALSYSSYMGRGGTARYDEMITNTRHLPHVNDDDIERLLV